jgi:tripartite-type tricarboxylate transporter receptor subunit TctC
MQTRVRGPTMKRWSVIFVTSLSVLNVLPSFVVAADDASTSKYPNRPIVLVAPFPPGHSSDIENRKIAPLLAEALGQPVTVENWTGKDGTAALEKMAHAASDGYTLINHGINGLAIAPHVMKVGYDPITNFAPIIQEFSPVPLVLLAYPGLPVSSVQELIAYGKSNPGKLNAASFAFPTNVHVALILFNRITGLTIPHSVDPAAQIMEDLAAGKFQLMFNFPLASKAYVKSGKLKALAVTGNARSVVLPDVPTFSEAGIPGMDIFGWQGFLAPAGTPPEIVAKLNAELVKTFISLNKEGLKIRRETGTPEEFAAFIKAENARWGKFIKDERIRLE